MFTRENEFQSIGSQQIESSLTSFIKRLKAHCSLVGSLSKRKGAFLFSLVLSAIVVSACGEKPLPAGEKEFAEGVSELESGDTTKAYELFAKAEENDPSRPWRKLGEARKTELYSSPYGAMGAYLEIMALTPDFDSAYTGYCRLALRFGKPQLAWNAVYMYARNRGVNVDEGVTQATAAGRNYDLIVAQVLQLRSEVDKAESRLVNLSKSMPEDGEVALALASVLLQQGRTDEALELARKTLANNSKRRDVLTAGIRFFVDAGYASDALALLKQARDSEKPNNIWANRLAIETYLRLGYLDHAAFTVSQMKQAGITDGLAYYLNGRIAESRGKSVQAKEWYLYSLSVEKKNIELFRDAARAATGANNFIQMEDNMNNVLRQLAKANYPSDYVADAHLQYAEYYVALKQWRPALDEIEDSRKSFEQTPRFELLRARTFYSMQAKDSAREAFSQIASGHKDSFEWIRGLALTFATIGEFDSAEVYVQKALQLQPNDFISLVARIDITRKSADSAGYARAVETLVREYPHIKRTLRIQSDYYLSLGDNVSALDVANRMVELYPGDLSAYNYAATLAGTRYGAQQGLKYLTDAQEQNPTIPAPYRKLATYYLRQGNIDTAETYWTKAFDLDTTDEATLLMNGVILEAKGFSDSAVAIYKHIINVDPFSAEAFNNLAWVMANNDIEPAQASNFAREAVALSGGVNGNIHGTLGWALFKEKKYMQANISLQLAIRFDPKDPFKRFMFGSILEEWGKKKEAEEQFQRALELGISGGYRNLVEKALARLKG